MGYNQIGDAELKNSCSVLAFLDYLKYEYYIEVPRDSIVSLLHYLEKIQAWFPKWGADAGVVFPALQKYIKWKYGLDIRIKVGAIDKINDGKGHILGFKGANKNYLTLTKDKEVTNADIDKMKVSGGHFFYYENGIVTDNLGGIEIKWSYPVIQYAYAKGLFYRNTREFEPHGEKTRAIAEKAQRVGKARKNAGFKRYYMTIREILDSSN